KSGDAAATSAGSSTAVLATTGEAASQTHDVNPQGGAENFMLGMPDMRLIAQRYTLDLMGNSQQLQIRSWPPQVARRFSKRIPLRWQGDKWYTMKLSAGT